MSGKITSSAKAEVVPPASPYLTLPRCQEVRVWLIVFGYFSLNALDMCMLTAEKKNFRFRGNIFFLGSKVM